MSEKVSNSKPMLTLVSGIYHWLFARPEVCILLVGLQGSGKTTFFEQLKDRYTKCGSRAAAGLSAPGSALRGGLQNEQAAQRQQDKEQQQWQPGRQMVTQEVTLRSDDKQQKDYQQAKHPRRDPPQPCNQQPPPAGKQDALVYSAESNGNTCVLPRVSSTTGLNFCRFRYKDVDVVLWDLAGVSSFRAIWVEYYRNAHCILYFVDSTSNVEGLQESRAALNSLTSAAVACSRKQDKEQKRGVCPPPLLIVAAKQDLASGFVSPRNSVQAVFSCENGRCCNENTAAEKLQTHSHLMHGRGDFLKDFPKRRCRLGALISHSACKLDSVEEVLQYAVRAAKAYYEFLSLSLPEVTTPIASVPGEEPRRQWPESANVHAISAIKAASRKKYTFFQSSLSWPVDCGRRHMVAGRSARMFPGGTQTRSLTEIGREKPAGRQPIDVEAESRSGGDALEVPCWHYATTLAACPAISVGDSPAASQSVGKPVLVSSQQLAGAGRVSTSAETCIDIFTSPSYESPAMAVTFAAAAPQLPCETRVMWNSSATDQEGKVKREHSGLYELEIG